MIKGIFVNVEEGTVAAKECENEFENLCKLIGCDMISTCHRKICGNTVMVLYDDLSRLKAKIKVSAVNDKNYTVHVGNIFIVNDGLYDFESLGDDVIEDILNNAVIIIEQNGIQRKILIVKEF